MHRLKVIESFLAGGHWWEGENPYPYSVGGAASGCRMLPVQVWGVNFCVGPGQHWTYTCTRNILNIGHTHALLLLFSTFIHYFLFLFHLVCNLEQEVVCEYAPCNNTVDFVGS